MPKHVGTLDATPSKRMFLSIIADYDLNRSICELIDNAIDEWVRKGRKAPVTIDVTLDIIQQTIVVTDDAGGIPKDDLRFVVGPGQTRSKPTDQTIGIFGVGTKRAVVALAQEVSIRTRCAKGTTHLIKFDEDWIQDEDDWTLPVFDSHPIGSGTTVVDLSRLRLEVTEKGIEHLRRHLGATYAIFLKSKQVVVILNTQPVRPHFFDNWAYPRNYPPCRFTGTLRTEDGRTVEVDATAGLSRESSPVTGEYGVYFYCNDRLIARGLKTFDVGFMRGLAGLPHPKVSLTRVLVHLKGDAQSMPWNSSKSDISTKHEVFLALRDWLLEVVKQYASLSRIWQGDWEEKVFRHTTGTIAEVQVEDFPTARKSFLPPPPKSRPRYGEIITIKNRAVVRQKPWTQGLYEGIIATDLISKQHRLEQRNRIALIVLDSTLEIGFKEYLLNESGTQYSASSWLNLSNNRQSVQNEVKKTNLIVPDLWKKIDHYYGLRCKLIHERATVGITDRQIEDFRSVVEQVLRKLFGLKFSKR